jgi:glutaconyl-CoA/methylmalonyl-CoA decarboxylase subunit delta
MNNFLQINETQIILDNHNKISGIILISSLIVLILLFFYFLKRTNKFVENKEKEKIKQLLNENKKEYIDPTEEITAAIALALSMYRIQLSEMENLSLTIQKASKMYSPWSSKIYSLRQLPR